MVTYVENKGLQRALIQEQYIPDPLEQTIITSRGVVANINLPLHHNPKHTNRLGSYDCGKNYNRPELR